MRFITDDEVDDALDYLKQNAQGAAQARANRIYMEEYRKVVKAELMMESNRKAHNAREEYAYANADYKKHLTAMRQAILEDERHRFLLSAKQAILDAWRTQSATERAMKI